MLNKDCFFSCFSGVCTASGPVSGRRAAAGERVWQSGCVSEARSLSPITARAKPPGCAPSCSAQSQPGRRAVCPKGGVRECVWDADLLEEVFTVKLKLRPYLVGITLLVRQVDPFEVNRFNAFFLLLHICFKMSQKCGFIFFVLIFRLAFFWALDDLYEITVFTSNRASQLGFFYSFITVEHKIDRLQLKKHFSF